MENKSVFQLRTEEENRILKDIKKGILKSAKKGDYHYYWDISSLSDHMVKSVSIRLENEGKNVNSKGLKFKIIRW